MTCISPWNDSIIDPGHGKGAGTAITARHIVLSAHYPFPLGTKVRFVTADNVVVESVVRGLAFHPDYTRQALYPDLVVYTLETPLPPSITPCKMLPANYADYLSYLGPGRPPVLALDQEEKALVFELKELGQPPTLRQLAKFALPELHLPRRDFNEILIDGDSGNPAFLIIKPPDTGLDTLVLLTTMSNGYAMEYGTFVTAQISKLNEMIVAADADATANDPLHPINTGLQVQTIDLGVSGFNTFTPPP